jgi:pyrimidine operon attenuation protein/uracil phosphoribosyltransferase
MHIFSGDKMKSALHKIRSEAEERKWILKKTKLVAVKSGKAHLAKRRKKKKKKTGGKGTSGEEKCAKPVF